MIDRRAFVAGAFAAPALLQFAPLRAAAPGALFSLGVASGDPTPDGMVLWTRLAPEPLQADGGMGSASVPVRWELAEDARFTRIVRSGTARADAAWGHSVHVEPRGLPAGRRYFYRFIAGDQISQVGRTSTAPALGQSVDRLRLCYGSCQKYEVGYYDAYRHMVAEDPDLILFLGDYIYEGKPDPKALRPHLNPEPMDVGGYRVRYATYKRDPLLQGAHAAAPWLLTWDDHEVANDYADALDQNNTDRVTFLRRRAAAYQVYWEHQPLRASARPKGPNARLYHAVSWGDLARFQIVDDRQYRGPRACQPPELRAAHKKYRDLVPTCPDLTADRTMLGARQEQWLMGELGSSRAQWNLLSQQTLMAPLPRIDPEHPEGPRLWSADTWSGYPLARDRIFRRWAEAKTPNPIALGGDIHSFAASDLHIDGKPVAAEFIGGSITSLFHDEHVKKEAADAGIRFVENEVRGYGRVDLTRDHASVTFRGLADATKPGSTISDLAAFTVEAGRPGIIA
jgi:alkaline phosphatase D